MSPAAYSKKWQHYLKRALAEQPRRDAVDLHRITMEAARRFAILQLGSDPQATLAVLEEIGSFPSSEVEYRALQQMFEQGGR